MAVFTGLGSAASPSITFSADTNTGIFSPGTDQVAISTNGTGRLFVDAGGNVGLGAGPTNVAGFKRIEIGEAGVSGGLLTLRSSGGAQEANISCSATGLGFTTNSYATPFDARASEIIFGTGSSGTERMRLDSSGRLGLGTPAPSVSLQIGGGSGLQQIGIFGGGYDLYLGASGGGFCGFVSQAASTVFNNSAVPLAIGTGQSQPLVFGTSGAERIRIDSSGRLLVGTSSARSNFYNSTNSPQLQIEGNDNSKAALAIIQDFNTNTIGAQLVLAKNNSTTIGTNVLVANGDTLGVVSFQGNDGSDFVEAAAISAQVDGAPGANDMPGRLVFSTTADGASNPTERMRIDSAGTHLLYGINDTLYSRTNRGAGTVYVTFAGVHSATSTTTGTASCYIYSNGNVVNTNNSYGALSDIKLKENIVDATSQWSDMKSLQVRKYNLKEGQTHTQIGLVAQEAELVSPGLVFESPDRDAEGNDLGTVTKSVNYSVLYMKAVKALQEAMERIETLEASNADILTRLSALEAA